MSVKVLVIDNDDSFTYNLVQYLGELGAELEVVRNDRASVDDLLAQEPDRVVVSPGPCTPNEAGISLEVVRRFPEAGVPRSASASATSRWRRPSAARSIRHEPVHGKTTTIEHDGEDDLPGLPSPLTVGRYHSLVVDAETLPDCLEVTATGGGVVMGIRHRELPGRGRPVPPRVGADRLGARAVANFLGSPHTRMPTQSSRARSTLWPPAMTFALTQAAAVLARDHGRQRVRDPDRRPS